MWSNTMFSFVVLKSDSPFPWIQNSIISLLICTHTDESHIYMFSFSRFVAHGGIWEHHSP
uniref:Predicted protein n=1 Tax=Hordeum vulgare subsp. vulgare TaxID=112509 RepID=F2DWW1_HORVV|nr:predicted protein [Hordeum vulgare subsp. vulgare]